VRLIQSFNILTQIHVVHVHLLGDIFISRITYISEGNRINAKLTD